MIFVRRWLESLPISFATICLPMPQPRRSRVDREVEDVQLGLVQFVDHEADDPLVVLGDHADAVPLTQAAEEIFLGPGVSKLSCSACSTSGMSRRIIQRI